jgi:hypothetical protein
MARLNCWYHVEDHSASFLAEQNFTCSKCAQLMFLFTLYLFHVARKVHIVNRIYVSCTDELKSIRARQIITTDPVRLIIHRDLAEVSIDDAGFFMCFQCQLYKSNHYGKSGYQMKKLRYINTQNIEPTSKFFWPTNAHFINIKMSHSTQHGIHTQPEPQHWQYFNVVF